MFPFSSLFTQIPLLILAAAYMLYFGAYAIGKTKENIADIQPEPKERSVITNQVSAANTFYYKTTPEVNQNVSVPEDITVTYSQSYISLLCFDPDSKICCCFNSYNLFSRPPPAKG